MSIADEVLSHSGPAPETPVQKRLVFTAPGKIGDALHQFPVVYWYCKQNNRRATLWLDKHTLKPLVNLFAAQPCIESVELVDGIKSWHMGGQPWNFDLPTSAHADNEVYHLGMREFPQRQITLETLSQVPLNIENPRDVKCLEVWDAVDLRVDPVYRVSPSEVEIDAKNLYARPGRVIMVDGPEPPPRLALHGTFVTHMSGVPGFWRFLADRIEEFRSIFGEDIYFTGSPAERQRARELYPDLKDVDDGGDFLHLARFMATCTCVIGAGSSNIVLASLLGIPSIRVHDPIGENPKVIWTNLASNHINDTEMELRTSWPEFRDQWVTPK